MIFALLVFIYLTLHSSLLLFLLTVDVLAVPLLDSLEMVDDTASGGDEESKDLILFREIVENAQIWYLGRHEGDETDRFLLRHLTFFDILAVVLVILNRLIEPVDANLVELDHLLDKVSHALVRREHLDDLIDLIDVLLEAANVDEAVELQLRQGLKRLLHAESGNVVAVVILACDIEQTDVATLFL